MGALEDRFFSSEPVEAPEYEYEEPYEEPGEPSEDWAEWTDYEAALEAQQFEQEEPEEGQIDPLAYPEAQAGEYEEEVGAELRRQALGEAFRDDLAGFVRETAGREYGIRDEQAVERVTQEILQARETLFRGWLGQGASVAQALQALEHLNFEAAAEVGLQQERYEASKRGTSLGAWQAGRAEQQRQDALAGRPPAPDIMAHPSIQRMGARMAAHAERQEQWQAGVDAAFRRQLGMR